MDPSANSPSREPSVLPVQEWTLLRSLQEHSVHACWPGWHACMSRLKTALHGTASALLLCPSLYGYEARQYILAGHSSPIRKLLFRRGVSRHFGVCIDFIHGVCMSVVTELIHQSLSNIIGQFPLQSPLGISTSAPFSLMHEAGNIVVFEVSQRKSFH